MLKKMEKSNSDRTPVTAKVTPTQITNLKNGLPNMPMKNPAIMTNAPR